MKWKKRRLAIAKVEMMREAKRVALERSSLTSPIPASGSACHLMAKPRSATQPGPSGLQLGAPVTSTAEIDSSNLTDNGGNSSSDSEFDDEKAQSAFDDWVVSLHTYDQKMLTFALFQTFKTRQCM